MRKREKKRKTKKVDRAPISQRDIEAYLDLPYSFTFLHDEDEGGYVVKVNELPGCMTQGKTKDDALRRAREAMYVWIESALEDGTPIPAPFEQGGTFSGRVLVRMPKTLHRGLAERAQHEGVSLNQLAVATLAGALGIKK